MTTFAELGMPFPLHDAPMSASNDSNFVGDGSCSNCGVTGTPSFKLRIGSALIVPCPACAAENGLEVSDKSAVNCRQCDVPISPPEPILREADPKICYACLRAGKAALTKDTEYGMVSWEQGFSGVTHGLPGLKTEQFEIVPMSEDGKWLGVRLPREAIWELLRTPTYNTWQGETWLFCCKSPMTFKGEWTQDQFRQHDSYGDGEELLISAVSDLPEQGWEAVGHGICVYMFECQQCRRFRGHWDCD